MPERHAQERLAEWRAAEKAERATEAGTVARRRAVAAARRARWAFEDAARSAAVDHGGEHESTEATTKRGFVRLREASANAAEVGRRPAGTGPTLPPETNDQRDKRVADDAEIRRELGTNEGS